MTREQMIDAAVRQVRDRRVGAGKRRADIKGWRRVAYGLLRNDIICRSFSVSVRQVFREMNKTRGL